MNILVVGCGKLGARLSDVFSYHGHAVSIVDRNPDTFNMLSEDFDGITVTGMPMDLDVLRNAGAEGCDAAAVVTTDDNLNITVSQILKEFFGVKNVVARIIDPVRQKIFKHFGLNTMCQTTLTCDAMFSAITHEDDERQLTFGNTTLGFSVRTVDPMLIGRSLDAVPVHSGETIIGVIDSNNNTRIFNVGKEIFLNPKDRIIYARTFE